MQYRNLIRRVAITALGALALGAGIHAWAAKVSERHKQKKAAEAERAELQQKLNALKQEISRTESARSHAADALAQSESAISHANRALHDLAEDQAEIEAKIKELSEQQGKLQKAITDQQNRLSRLLRDQYVAGNEDRIKLLLSGDNPNRINRELQYMGYVSQSQAKLIDSLRTNLAAVENNKTATQEAQDELAEVEREQREQKALLEKEKAKRATLLAQLSSRL
jgi:septal ring factor EnvC (AmiA/AmiB activator)